MSGNRRWSLLVLAVAVAVLVNTPLLQRTWTDWRVERDGVDVTAEVTGAEQAGDHSSRIAFVLPEEVAGPAASGATWYAVVDAATRARAERTGTVSVRVLPEEPALHRVDGEVRGRALLVATLVGDAVLLGLVLLVRRYRGRLRPQLRLVATEDVAPGPPGAVLERLEAQRYLVAGAVVEAGDGRVVLDLGDRTVRVDLDGHHNPVATGRPARVVGLMVG